MKQTLLNASGKLLKAYWKTLFLIVMLSGFSSISTAQVTTYTYSEISGVTYTPITGTNAFGTTTPDDEVIALGSEIPIGFTFNFSGTNYTNLRISANGFITFGGSTSLAGVLGPINGAGDYTGAISGYSRDLVYSSYGSGPIYTAAAYPSSVEYLLSGSVGSQVFTVQFKNMARKNSGSTVAPYDGLVNFQIKLYEGTNVVKIIHNAQMASTAPAAGGLGQTGLRGTNVGTDWVTRLANALNWTSTTAGAVNQGINYRSTSVLSTPHELQWTPPCYAPTAPAVGSITTSSASLSWTAPVILPPGYQYEVRTSGAAGSGSTGLAASGTVTTSPASATGLAEGITYTWYVRSSCGSLWVTGPSFTTACGTRTIPYYRYFDESDFAIPAIPQCMSIQNMGTGNNWTTSNVTTASAAEDFYDEHLVYDATVGVGGTQAANVWFFTPGFNLTTGVTYKIFYEYGGSTDSPSITNKMMVMYGNAASNAGMTVLLQDHDNIKTSLTQNSVSFSVASSGIYYFGFKAYSAANQGRLYVDSIEITEPGCKFPTGLSISSITSSSAQASWTAPSPAPGNGYAYYVSTSSTTPSYGQTPTGYTATGITLANLTGLSGSTTYYVWVRGYCGTNDFSQWSTVASFTTLVQPPYCIPAPVSTSSYITNFTTTGGSTNISNSSGFSAGGYGNYTNLVVTQIAGSSVNFSLTNNDTFLGAGLAIWIDWNNDGVFTNSAPNERVYNSAAYIFGGPVTGTITVPGGQAVGSYRMRIMDDYWATSPDPCLFSTISPPTRGEAEDYTFTVGTPPPALTLNTNGSAQCANTDSPLITITPATIGNYQVYTWSPTTGVTGDSTNGYVINSNSSIVYTLTGFNTTTLKTNTATFTYTANPVPTPITIAPSSTTLCQNGSAVLLTATGGNVSGVAVMSENFNTTALGTTPPSGWTTSNTGTGGTSPANATLTIRPDGYSVWWTGITHSNDSSQFIFTDADSQGQYGVNNVTLTSPVFSLPSPGYTTANLSFWHYYEVWNADTFIGVEISTDGGLTWPTVLQSYTGVNQGTNNSFANININLNAYIGQTNLRIRFRYNSTWGYGWAIDNVLVSGSASTNTSWNTATSPVANGVAVPGLYTNAAATTAYLAGTISNTVYALPSTTTTYAASASTLSPPICSVSQTVVVTVTPTLGGTASPDQSLCGGAPADIVLTGSSGTIQWQYADDLAFTTNVTNIGGATSATLTSAQMGVLTGNRYYRAVLTNGACALVYSNVVTVTTSSTTTSWSLGAWSNGPPTISKAVTFFDNFTSSVDAGPSGNISACSVTIASGANVLFDVGTLTVQNKVTVTSGTLTFNNGASLYQVGDVLNAPGVYSGGNTGDIRYNRTTTGIRKYDYTYWSTPVNPQTLVDVSPDTPFEHYYYFNASINNWQYIASNNLMDVGKGYIIRAPFNYDINTPANYTALFEGVPNSGTITTTIVGGAGQMNLIGNPYPSALSASAFILDAANTNVNGTIYLWTHNTPINGSYQYTGSDYAIYNLVGGTSAATNPQVGGGGNGSIPLGYIAAGQGFFIKGFSNGTATFKNSMRAAGNNSQFYRLSPFASTNNTNTELNLEKHRYWLDIANSEGAFKQTLIGYVATATNGIDRLFDGEMVDVGNAITLYTIVDNTKLSIQGKELAFDVNETIPLGYKSTINSTYTISLSDFDGLFESQNIYLEDTLLNVVHDLKASPYSFATNIGTFDERFILRYTTEALGITDPIFNGNTVVVYQNNTGLHINTGTENMENVTIYDVRGREIASQKQIGNTITVFTTLPTTQQVLLVKIEGENGGIVTKKVVY
jgi:hypothetical protein